MCSAENIHLNFNRFLPERDSFICFYAHMEKKFYFGGGKQQPCHERASSKNVQTLNVVLQNERNK